MRLRSHITQVNVPGVVTQTGRIAMLLGLLWIAPAGVGALFGEGSQVILFGGTGAFLLLAGWLAARQGREDIGFTEGLVITALSYLVAALAGVVPFLSVVGFADAFFESMSGFTTTGLTLVPLADLPRSLLFFRAFSQWIGGAGIVVLTLVILLRTTKPAHRLYVSEAGEGQIMGSVRTTAAAVAKVYLVLTGAAVLLFFGSGMDAFDAVLHALATVSTGGFSPYADSLGHFPQRSVRLAVFFFMLVGATSFPLFYRARKERIRGLFRDPQVRALLGGMGALWGLLWLTGGQEGPLPALFHAVTALTTTGFSLSDPAAWDPAALSLAVGAMIVGGSAGSTAGGIKLIRVLVLLRLGGWMIARTLLPEEAKLPVRHGDLVTSEADLLGLAGFGILYLAVLGLSALALTFSGAPLGSALFEAASALGTVGLSAGVTSPDLEVWAKMVLALDMWVGRLEIVPVMVLLYPGVWRGR